MHHVPLLVNVALALAYALLGGMVARRLRMPTIVGYILAGVALGPFTPGFIGDVDAIQQLAELGVVLLMFGVGLHFSLRDLWEVRDIAIPGALVQMAFATALGYWMARGWGWSPSAALVLGVAISVASTVVLLRGLMDRGELDSTHGRVAVGWLVLEDLATVVILVLLPAFLAPDRQPGWQAPALAIAKAILFVVLMLVVGKRLIPLALSWIASTGSRELFVLVALTAALGTAIAAASLFGVSLALGPFVAGVIVSESPFSHQVSADLLPFREAFAVLFFVSVGMLVNPGYLVENWTQVAALTALIVVGKALVAALIGFALPYPAKTALVVGAGLSQIGEFSFIVGQAGLAMGVLEKPQYSLILAGAIVSVTLNPWVFRLVEPAERLLRRAPRVWRIFDRHRPGVDPTTVHDLSGHVVIVGCGRVGEHIAGVLGTVGVPRLVVEASPPRAEELRRSGVPVLFGDAANSEVLRHAGLDRARALVVTVPDDAAAVMISNLARAVAPGLYVVSRASSAQAIDQLRNAGASAVVLPELEGSVEIVRRTFLGLGYPQRDVERYTDALRREGLGPFFVSDDRSRVLADIAQASDLDAAWVVLAADSVVRGQSVASSGIRGRTGATIVAIGRRDRVISNPDAAEPLLEGDRIALIGSPGQIAAATALITAS